MSKIARLAAVQTDRRLLLVGAAAVASAIALPSVVRAEDPVEITEGGAAEAGTVVEIEKMAFQTPEAKVKVGDTVTWVNKDDGMAHNVHFRAGPMKGNPKARGKMLNKDEKYSVKFLQPGEYDYICTPHPIMKAKVIVEA